MTARLSAPPPRVAAAALGAAVLGALALLNHRQARRAERDNPPKGRLLQVHGVRLHLLDRGPAREAGGPPAVLLHGNGGTADDFLTSGLVDRLALRRRVIAFDRPGYGHSERPRGRPWTPRRQADLLAAALRRLGVEGAVVHGHSWGSLVAVEMALAHPDVVGALVLEAGYFFPSARLEVLPMSVPAIPVLGDLLRHTVSPLLSRLLWPLQMRVIFGPPPVPPKWAGFPRALALRPSQLRASAEESALQVPAAWSLRGRYEGLRVPVTLVAGARDRMVSTRAQTARLHRLLPGSRLVMVPEAGHMVHHTATSAVLDALDGAAGPRLVAPRAAA